MGLLGHGLTTARGEGVSVTLEGGRGYQMNDNYCLWLDVSSAYSSHGWTTWSVDWIQPEGRGYHYQSLGEGDANDNHCLWLDVLSKVFTPMSLLGHGLVSMVTLMVNLQLTVKQSHYMGSGESMWRHNVNELSVCFVQFLIWFVLHDIWVCFVWPNVSDIWCSIVVFYLMFKYMHEMFVIVQLMIVFDV